MQKSRRTFIRNLSILATSFPFIQGKACSLLHRPIDSKLEVHIFSKQLQFLDYKAAGEIAAELGFNGIDLTVRPKGHVNPQQVITDLPKAISDLKAAGSSCKMITTNVGNINQVLDKDVIRTAAQQGVQFYRSAWFKYQKDRSMTDSLLHYQKLVNQLGEFNKQNNIIGCYQNHAGKGIGSSFWEIHKLLETVDPQYFGTQYDIRHATVEGGYSWQNGLELLHKSIKVIVLKDSKWKKVNGKWKSIYVPIGEGMVDFTSYFKLLKSYGMAPPVSLHLEYPLGGAEHGHQTISVDKKVVFDAMKKDLKTIQELWKSAS